jgi:small subunit ribosomal protein S15
MKHTLPVSQSDLVDFLQVSARWTVLRSRAKLNRTLTLAVAIVRRIYCCQGGSSKAVALAKETKEQILADFRTHEADTGSPQVQVALLSKRINGLTEHFKTHKKDNHSRRGLLKMVSQRRSMLDYLKRTDIERYHEVVNRLGLRR